MLLNLLSLKVILSNCHFHIQATLVAISLLYQVGHSDQFYLTAHASSLKIYKMIAWILKRLEKCV